jgi:hypothetical protein
MCRSIILALIIASSWACSDPDRPSPPSDAGPDPDADRPEAPRPGDGGTDGDAGTPAVHCPSGALLVHYSLTPLSNAPSLDAIQLPGLHPATIIVSAGMGGASNSLRLDVCQEPAGPKLQAILLRGASFESVSRFVLDHSVAAPVEEFVQTPQGMVAQIRLPPAAMVVDGLAGALAGDIRALRVRVLGERGLLVMGHPGFLAIARGRVTPSAIDYTSLYVLVGGLAPGDVFANLRCPFNEDTLTSTFRLDTVTFDIQACTFLGGGSTTGYRIHHLVVQDSNPALEESDRRRFEFTTEAEVKAVLNYRWNHHNACDSFHLALGHADYAASTAPLAGCGAQVPNAPARSFDEPSTSPVLYRIRYYGGAWKDGSIPGCSHYLFCNRPAGR